VVFQYYENIVKLAWHLLVSYETFDHHHAIYSFLFILSLASKLFFIYDTQPHCLILMRRVSCRGIRNGWFILLIDWLRKRMQVSTHRQIARPSSLFAVRFRLEILLASRRQGLHRERMDEHGRRSLQARSNAPIDRLRWSTSTAQQNLGMDQRQLAHYLLRSRARFLVEQANVQLLFRHALDRRVTTIKHSTCSSSMGHLRCNTVVTDELYTFINVTDNWF
jgi:hypothetical protein